MSPLKRQFINIYKQARAKNRNN